MKMIKSIYLCFYTITTLKSDKKYILIKIFYHILVISRKKIIQVKCAFFHQDTKESSSPSECVVCIIAVTINDGGYVSCSIDATTKIF